MSGEPFRIPIGRVVVTEAEKRAVLRTLDSGHLSPGQQASKFEKEFARFIYGRKQGVLVNSGTDALRIALWAMKEYFGWADGAEVIVPALTFVSTVNVVLQCDLRPVFVDVQHVNSPTAPFCMDLSLVDAAITKKTRCILPVHMFGLRAEMPTGQANNVIRILEDSCESLDSECYGDIACFSFYVCHLLSLGVGGMAVTDNTELASLMRSLANHGRDPRFLGTQVSKAPNDLFSRFSFERLGYSSRITEMQAAMGRVQLVMIKEKLAQRKAHATQLYRLLWEMDSLHMVDPSLDYFHNHSWMMFPIVLRETQHNVKEVCAELEQRGIETRPLMPLLTQPVYRRLFPGEYKKHPTALALTSRGFYIGCHEYLTESDLGYVAETFRKVLTK